MKQLHSTFFLFILMLSFLSCASAENNNRNQADLLDKQTQHCLKSEEHPRIKFIEFSDINDSLSGTIYTYHEYFGEVYYKFKGKRDNDNIQVQIESETGISKENWEIKQLSDGTIINGIFDENEPITFKNIDCNDLPDLSNYMSVEDMAVESRGEMLENTLQVCYHYYYPQGGSERVRQLEYIQIDILEDAIRGKGAGYFEGDGNWGFTFDGHAINDSTYEIAAHYKTDFGKTYTTSEKWVLSSDKTTLTVQEVTPDSFQKPGREYHQIECDNAADWAKEIMQNL